MTFAEVLKKERNRKGMTQEELAEALGYSRSKIGMYESGKREPGLDDISIICDYFNIDSDYLLGKSEVRRKVWFDEFGTEYQPSSLSDGNQVYYVDPETSKMAEEIHKNSDLKMLFDATRNMPPEDIKKATEIIKLLKDKENGE